jgi:hypothetical protein
MKKQFGICALPGTYLILAYLKVVSITFSLPESICLWLSMEPYTEMASTMFKLNASDHWLRKRQGVALPVLPPTTLEARQYFFTKIRELSTLASSEGKSQIDYERFACEWNSSADGKDCFYVTTKVLTAYAKTWEKNSNIRASQDLISDQLDMVQQTSHVFAAPQQPFPHFLTAPPTSIQPCKGILEISDAEDQARCQTVIPPSLNTNLSISRPRFMGPDFAQSSKSLADMSENTLYVPFSYSI